MKGFIRKALTSASGLGLLALTGCVGMDCTYDDVVDPCYPWRYASVSKHELNEAMAPQMMNGHVLEQTVFDTHFEAGSDKLTAGGLEHLKYLAKRRPQADPIIFLQTAQDVPYDAAAPDAYVKGRAELNNKRVQAIQKFLIAYTAAAPQEFRVVIHDPPEVGQSAIGVNNAVRSMYNSYTGSLGGVGGGGGSASSGGTTSGGSATATATSSGSSTGGH